MDNAMLSKGEKKFVDANVMDKRIPKELIMMYQSKPYILYGGLLWKAMYLYGGGNFGITTEIVEKTPEYVLVKAIFKTKDGIEFNNFGEASKANVTNPQMYRYLLHLAITRATCRVCRMATACGFASYEEMFMGNENGIKELPISEKDGEPATAQQIKVLEGMKGEIKEGMTQKDAKEAIAILAQKK